VHWLFVYGTLMPGRLRWPHVADDVVDRRPATVPGTLYDTGHGYPALVLSRPAVAGPAPGGADVGGDDGGVVAGGGVVHGWLLGFPDAAADRVMAGLDEVEGPSYVRAAVLASDGTEAVTYAWPAAVPDGFTALAGRWESVEER
jgi:gamma-glutamylcyclotransferase (GGCT)/AIG2-like uncharacterized protein YtfP